MTRETPKELFEKGLITEEQFKKIDLIVSGKIVSVFYELRSLLYLGVMLFTAGVGILIYQNIGELGHLLAIITLSVLTVICFWYVFRHALPYSNGEIKAPTPYFDYIVLLGSLLFISVQGYLQFQFGWLDENLGISTLITAAFFFFIAYRFDHLGVLSLAITALASFWSISISPQKWYSGNFFSGPHIYTTAIIFGSTVGGIAVLLDKKGIKKHFTFTYLNFCTLIFFVGSIAGLFSSEIYFFYVILIYAGCAFAYYIARWEKSFLFMLYAFIAAYIATTYLLAETIFRDAIEIWFLYSIASCGGFIYFLISYRKHFNQKS
ncbi:MAG: DUF2157 domain-containing protein [Cyclobacteriaceae bacterium]|nr:DUF2157 domain-containing protein [Cyclobacteriaceae bacterium]